MSLSLHEYIFPMREREREFGLHGGIGGGYWCSIECQGQALACSKSLAQEVKSMCVCVCMSSSTMKLSMEAWELSHKMN